MIHHRIIPSLLLKDGRLVKGVRFGDWRDAGNPATTVRAYNAQKADELILLDIAASAQGRGPDLDAVAAVAAECQMPLTVGGGVDGVEVANACLRAGADKIFVNTAALDRPELIGELAHAFGAQAVVVGIDITGEGRIFDYRTQAPLIGNWLDWARECKSLGAGEIRLMAVDREGGGQGMHDALWKAASEALAMPVILEGGAGGLQDLADVMTSGVDSLALGTMLIFQDNNIIQVKRYLKNLGFPIRL